MQGNKRNLFIAIFVAAVIGIIVLIFTGNSPQELDNADFDQVKAPQKTKPPEPKNKIIAPLPETEFLSQFQLAKSKENSSKGVIATTNPAELDKLMQKRFAEIADQVAVMKSFPAYSFPIGEADWDLYHPREFVPHKRFINDNEKFSFQIELPRYVFFYGEKIPVTLKLMANTEEPIPIVQSVQGSIVNLENQVLDTFTLNDAGDQPAQKIFQVDYLPDAAAEKWDNELTLRIDVKLEGIDVAATIAPFQLVARVAQVVGKKTEYVNEADLVIPIQVKVEKEGIYELRANLMLKEKNKPVAHLVQRAPLQPPAGIIELKANGITLNTQEAPGPYFLQDFNLTKTPDRPGAKVQYGTSEVQTLDVKAFPLNGYSLKPIVDPLAEERIKLLLKLAGKGENFKGKQE